MSDTDLVAHAVILYAASFETTANVLAWTLFLIAQHPDIAASLHDEIVERFADRPPDNQQIDDLPLLDGVVQESMRLLPPVPLTFRTPLYAVEIGGLLLRTGDKILLSQYLTHRDPDVFRQPNRFNPLRWFTIRPDPYEYLPFSAGPRICLGISFAQLELKLTIVRVMQRFRMNVVPGSPIERRLAWIVAAAISLLGAREHRIGRHWLELRRLRPALRQRGRAARDGVPGEHLHDERPALPLRGERFGRELRRRLAQRHPGRLVPGRLRPEVLRRSSDRHAAVRADDDPDGLHVTAAGPEGIPRLASVPDRRPQQP
jgi:hypothetical protein